MKQFYLILIPLFFVFFDAAGQEDGDVLLFGEVTDEDGKTLIGVHVIDRSTFIGTTTNRSGEYRIMVNNMDTLLFSFLGFKSREFIIPEVLKGNSLSLDIKMEMDTLMLKSAVIYPYPADANALMKGLLTVEIPDTTSKVDLHFEMIPIVVEIDMDDYRSGEMNLLSAGPAISQIYDAVSHEGKMKRKYQQVLEREHIDKLAAARLTDSLIMRATGLVEKESVKAFREYCDLKPGFIVKSTEYELYIALLDCYKSFSSR